ncbi:MAG: DUF1289 domain-containing protein [Marinosulfonomonas sp.]|nr:DUF1289 domain-containing protein [Marinosulfonomonas sp.]
MSRDIWKRDEVQSPCTDLCTMHPDTGLCLGCARTIDEIGGWSQLTPAERARVMAELPNRDAQPQKRRGGRAARRAE